MIKAAVLSSGGWGTALALVLKQNGVNVALYSHDKNEADAIVQRGENKLYLPGVALPPDLTVSNDAEKCVRGADFIISAAPCEFVRGVCRAVAPLIGENAVIVSVSKGLEEGTLLRMSQVINEEAPRNPVVCLSGPSHAEEVARGIPTAVVCACENAAHAKAAQALFMNRYFRVYEAADTAGVELGGALKNVIALAAGITEGLGFGDNTKAALFTRGVAEMTRLGVRCGASAKTFAGLAGTGDLFVTCGSNLSRNKRAGVLLGEGKSLKDTLSEVFLAVEGAYTARSALALANRHGVEMPITEEVINILYNGKDPESAVWALMARGKKAE